MTRLQILITAFGRKGIESIASLPHPAMEGVEYIVSWQYADADPADIPSALLDRRDFRILPTSTRGLSVNRNLTLKAATAPIAMISDDDVYYTPDNLRDIIKAFDDNPDADCITFRYQGPGYPQATFTGPLDLRRPPKGWSVVSCEIAFRPANVRQRGIRFNELFGIGAEFPSGEEEIFLHDIIASGLKAIGLPTVVVIHPGDTTAMRTASTDTFIRTKGAVFSILHPLTWPLRLLAHTRRFSNDFSQRRRYIRAWLRGVKDYRNFRK